MSAVAAPVIPGDRSQFPILTRDALIGPLAVGPRHEEVIVHLPNADGSATAYRVYVFEMTARAKTEFDQAMIEDPTHPWETLSEDEQNARLEIRQSEIRERLVIATAGDEHGNRLFTYNDIDDLGTRGASIIEPLFAAARRLNKADAEPLEALGKNFAGTNVSVSS